MEVADVVLLAQVVDGSPVGVRHAEPLAVARPDVDVDGAERVVLLVAGSPAPRYLHVQLDRVHAQDAVTHMGEHVARGHDAGKGRELHELLELGPPLALVRQVHVRAELDRLEAVLASTLEPSNAQAAEGRPDRVFGIRVGI